MEDDSNNEDSDCEDDEEFMLNIQEKDAMYDELYEWASAGQKCTSNTWIADSRASCHMTNNDENMTDVKILDEYVKIGNRKQMKATKIGNVSCMVKESDGSSQRVTLQVKFVSELWVNLFSLTKPYKLEVN